MIKKYINLRKPVLIVSLAVSMAFGLYSIALATNGPIGYWKLDESSGTSADSSGNGNTGTLSGNAAHSTTIPSQITCFNNSGSIHIGGGLGALGGGNNYVGIADSSSIRPTTAISISLWVKAADTTTSDYQYLLFKQYGSGGSANTSYGMWITTAGKIYTELNTSSHSFTGNTVLADNTWYHVALTYNGTTERIYVNGVQDTLDSASPAGIGTIPYDTNILKLGGGYYNHSLDGNLDDVRIYDRQLSGAEISDLANGGCGPGQAAEDHDNISTSVESAGPNSGDANGDGIQDDRESNVTSLPNSVVGGGAYTTLAETGGHCGVVQSLSITPESSSGMDTGYDYPLGLANFVLTCGAAGDTATIKIYYDKQYDTTGWVARKFKNGTFATIPGAVFGTATVGSTTVTTLTYSVVDGGPQDDDGTANGIIVDPAGPAIVASTSNTSQPGSTSAPNTGTIGHANNNIVFLIADIGVAAIGIGVGLLRHKSSK